MNPTNTSWAALYESNHYDGGAIHSLLFVYKDDALAEMITTHLEDADGLITIIAIIGGVNILLVPSIRKGYVEVIHQRFTTIASTPRR
jgi:hypothetical protein